MIRNLSIKVPPEVAASADLLKKAISREAGCSVKRLNGYTIERRSVDARAKQPLVVLQLRVFVDEPAELPAVFEPALCNVASARRVLIAGAGPAGLFAALKLISLGLKPVMLERGKDVRQRRRDLAAISREGTVNPESNYCFGEGGAGTYSDGKLYTRSTKRGDVNEILRLFHYFGANPEILFETHPHIGTNKLPGIITAMREAIVGCGGEVHFDTKITDIVLHSDALTGVVTAAGNVVEGEALILATGHSAHDIFLLLERKKIDISCKPFALGVRIEHPQTVIDSAMYHCADRGVYLPPASYSLVTQENGRGVFSFCMCPGGIIAPAATAPGEVVVNGWSPSKRNNPYANSGTVVAVNEADFARYGFFGNLAALQYQQMVEQRSFAAGGGRLVAPAQRLGDFVRGRLSPTLPGCSYLPGVRSAPLSDVLPTEVSEALRQALPVFGKKLKGYDTNEAIVVATESRTSSPVRIPRNPNTLEHTQIKGLYPCGEGAGYAGGIVSAAIDGERCAVAIAQKWGLAVR